MGCAQTEKKMSLTECSHTGMVRYEEVRTSTSHDGFARSVCRNTTVDDAGYFRESAFFDLKKMYGQMGGTPRERARTGRGGKAHNELALPTAKTNALCLHDLACTMTDMYSAVDDVTLFPTCFVYILIV